MSQQSRFDAVQPMKFKIIADAAAAPAENRVPVYRVKGQERRLMGWAERSERLRGAKEIRLVGDSASRSCAEVIYSKSDA